MTRVFRGIVSAALAAGLLVAVAPAQARPTPAQQCQAGKNRAAGKYAACRENAEANLATSGDTTKYGEAITKCGNTFAASWQKLEDKAVAAGSACPSVGDASDETAIDGRVAATTDTVAALVGGVRFEDNGNGTVTDHQTGLQWEQKVRPGGGATDPHDVDNVYSWSSGGGGTTFPDGTVFTDFLAKLNGAADGECFLNKCDWRLPNINELQTIGLARCDGTSPCIDPIFGPTATGPYWSATRDPGSPNVARDLSFAPHSGVGDALKDNDLYVRAVRYGS